MIHDPIVYIFISHFVWLLVPGEKTYNFGFCRFYDIVIFRLQLMNLAIVSNSETAITWPKVLISKGQIPPVDFATADVNEEGDIEFTWTNNAGTGTAKGNDTAILVTYFPESREAVFQFSEVTRNDGYVVLQMNSKKGIAETWLGFLSADEKNAASSVYTGRLTFI